MGEPPSHKNYELPGLQGDPIGITSAMMLNAFGYSRRWNNRRLEHTFHGVWGEIFAALIHDLRPSMQLIPQFRLESINNGPLPATLALDASFSTQTGGAEEKIPDFALVLLDVIKRDGMTVPEDFPVFRLWRLFKLRGIETPLLSDLKRPAPRGCSQVEHYRIEVETIQRRAQVSLEEQGPVAFAMQPDLQKVILIGTCGEWWSWRVLTRAECQPNDLMDDDEDDLMADDGDDSASRETDPVGSDPPPNSALYYASLAPLRHAKELRRDFYREASIVEEPVSAEHESTIPYSRGRTSQKKKRGTHQNFYLHEDLGKAYMENELDYVDIDLVEQRRTRSWSNNILYGTCVSNQQFYVIHQLLKRRMEAFKKGPYFWERRQKRENLKTHNANKTDDNREAKGSGGERDDAIGDNDGDSSFYGSDLTDSEGGDDAE